jgi:hypothetical protein
VKPHRSNFAGVFLSHGGHARTLYDLKNMTHQQAVPEDGPLLTAEHLRSATDISHALGVLSAELSTQAELVQGIAGAAEESLDNVRGGNKELMEAVSRPSTLRDAAVALLLLLWALLLFLDWHTS